ncbi:MAG: M20 family metallopeptidase [Armatimonadetes bacterium]|nr:M20 family metallopeptidase [Armatimonadota bacterium]
MSHPFASYVDARRDEIVETLRRVVEMESPSQEKARVDAVIDVFQAAYRDAGFVTRRIPQTDYGDHLVADLPGGGGPRVLLVGHADTVYPPGTLATMPLRRDGDRLLGPAVMDMKGGLVCMLYAIRALLVVRGAVRGSLRVVVNSDEEPGSPSSRGLWPELTQGVDWALICEPARPDGALVLSRKGCGIFRVRVRGQAAHAGAEPEKGASAIRALARKILDIEGLAAPSIGTTINTGVIRGGTHPYVVPEEAEAVIDIRVSTLAERDRVLAGMQAVAAREDVPRTQAVLEGQFHRPPSEPVPGTERLAVVIEEEGRALDVPIRWAPQTGGVGDANNITACGVPTVDGMGPVGGRAHSPEEYMEIPTLFQKTALLAAVLDRLVGREVLRRV